MLGDVASKVIAAWRAFAEDEWSQLLTSEDYRGLTPLTWAHVAMHGEFKLSMNSRLDLGHTSP